MIVCHCEAVNDRAVEAAISAGASTLGELTALCRAGGCCGGCHEVLRELLEDRSGAALADASSAA